MAARSILARHIPSGWALGACGSLAGLVLLGVVSTAWGITTPKSYSLYYRPDDRAAQSAPRITTLVAVGDIMPGRTVEEKMQRHGWDYPFEYTAGSIQAADIAFANLESPLIEGPTVPPYGMAFRAAPESADALQRAGFDVLSLANNHMKNQGTAGIERTRDILKNRNIAITGAGSSLAEASRPAVIEHNGLTFGFVACVEGSLVPRSYLATPDKSGSPECSVEWTEKTITSLAASVDVAILSIHMGVEYSDTPSATQKTITHTAIDAGAKLVLGHHPHVLQPEERYNEGLILYSLGNFVFDQMWSQATRESVIATVTFQESEIQSIEYTPLMIQDYAQPRAVDPAGGESLLERLRVLGMDILHP